MPKVFRDVTLLAHELQAHRIEIFYRSDFFLARAVNLIAPLH